MSKQDIEALADELELSLLEHFSEEYEVPAVRVCRPCDSGNAFWVLDSVQAPLPDSIWQEYERTVSNTATESGAASSDVELPQEQQRSRDVLNDKIVADHSAPTAGNDQSFIQDEASCKRLKVDHTESRNDRRGISDSHTSSASQILQSHHDLVLTDNDNAMVENHSDHSVTKKLLKTTSKKSVRFSSDLYSSESKNDVSVDYDTDYDYAAMLLGQSSAHQQTPLVDSTDYVLSSENQALDSHVDGRNDGQQSGGAADMVTTVTKVLFPHDNNSAEQPVTTTTAQPMPAATVEVQDFYADFFLSQSQQSPFKPSAQQAADNVDGTASKDPLHLSEWPLPSLLWSRAKCHLPQPEKIFTGTGSVILYLVQSSLRLEGNLALQAALWLSQKLTIPLVALVRITPQEQLVLPHS